MKKIRLDWNCFADSLLLCICRRRHRCYDTKFIFLCVCLFLFWFTFVHSFDLDLTETQINADFRRSIVCVYKLYIFFVYLLCTVGEFCIRYGSVYSKTKKKKLKKKNSDSQKWSIPLFSCSPFSNNKTDGAHSTKISSKWFCVP